MGYESIRRDDRYQTTLAAVLTFDGQRYLCLTENVSLRGLRLRADAMPMVRQQVRVEVCLPWGGPLLPLQGNVSYTAVESGRTRVMIGVDVCSRGTAVSCMWEQVVVWARAERLRKDPLHRATTVACFRPNDDDELRAVWARTRYRGSLMVDTATSVFAGEKLRVVVMHPATGRLHTLRATVVRRSRHGCRHEALAQLATLRASEDRDLERFIRGVPPPPGARGLALFPPDSSQGPATRLRSSRPTPVGLDPVGRLDSGQDTRRAGPAPMKMGACHDQLYPHVWLTSRKGSGA